MSRTYRIKYNKGKWRGWKTPADALEKMVVSDEYWRTWVYVKVASNSKEGKKMLAMFHRDKHVRFKEPGPSWFRNLFTERPLRRETKAELKKYLVDPDYEPMVDEKGKLEYWT